jgi:hypothetical protein
VFGDYCDGSDAMAAARVDGPEDEALLRLRAWLHSPEDTDPDGCLLARGTAELAAEDDTVAARALTAYDTLLDSCRELVEQAQRAGLVDPGADPATRNRIADAAIGSIAS